MKLIRGKVTKFSLNIRAFTKFKFGGIKRLKGFTVNSFNFDTIVKMTD